MPTTAATSPLPMRTRLLVEAEPVSPTAQLAERYFTAWQARDDHTLREILAENVTFTGPLGQATGREDAITGLMRMLDIVTTIDVILRVADGDDVVTWFDLHTSVAAPTATANWTHIEHGRITRIQVTFDPRNILAGS